jgi:protoporphyrinogen oxidase
MRHSNIKRADRRIVVIGGGFCGLAAAFYLARAGEAVTLLEGDAEVGGLAGSFDVGGRRLEKFYHHWFTSDRHVMQLLGDLGCEDQMVTRPTRTGVYVGNAFFKLSSPLDLIRFQPLSLIDRLRLGLLVLRARRVRDWQTLEHRSAIDWLIELGGSRVYEVVWKPLLRGKFGEFAEDVAAVWFWNKLKLRGGSRGRGGREELAYYRGGFQALANEVVTAIEKLGGKVVTSQSVTHLLVAQDRISGVRTLTEKVDADVVIATPALPIIADLLSECALPSYVAQLRRIRYLANACVVLELDRSLSDTYWLNVNDPSFPFVGVIEHTNFEPSSSYAGKHIVYLSKYLPESDPLFSMSDADWVKFSIGHLRRMFPAFEDGWLLNAHVWRARFSQPIVERGYCDLIPDTITPISGLYLATMAQVYPEDRGTNYAIRQGQLVARRILADVSRKRNEIPVEH